VTLPGKTPEEPGARRHPGGPRVPAQRLAEEDWRELQDPYDLPFPDDYDPWTPGRPEYVIVVDRLRGWQPDAPRSLAELLESIPTREPEPDPEAEP
jgi:hypothetical protein